MRNIKIVFEVQDAETGQPLVEKSEITLCFDYHGALPAKAEMDQIYASFVCACKVVQAKLGTMERYHEELLKV